MCFEGFTAAGVMSMDDGNIVRVRWVHNAATVSCCFEIEGLDSVVGSN